MRLLLTRPRDPDDLLAATLLAHGHEFLAEPLLNIEHVPLGNIDIAQIQAVVATSSNSLRAVDLNAELTALPLFAVGAATGRIGLAKGFTNVISGRAGAQELVAELAASLDPGLGTILYLRGETVAFDIEKPLKAAGFAVVHQIVYRAVPVTNFSPQAAGELSSGKLDGVILLSPRTTQTYLRLLQNHSLLTAAAAIRHFCLSQAVAEPLIHFGIHFIDNPAQPNLQELVALIDL